jgi:hypothetical protein
MTNRDRFSKIADFIIQSLSIIIFLISVAILFVVMFITLPEDVNWQDMLKQPENYSLIIITIILNIQVKLIGSTLTKHKYQQSNEYQFAEKVDGKTTAELLKHQHKFIEFNVRRTLKNKAAAQYDYLSQYGYTSIEDVRQDMVSIKPTKQAYKLNRKHNRFGKETFELLDQLRRYKQAPKIIRGYRKVKYISTIIHKTFWSYINQAAFKKGRRVLMSYRPLSKIGPIAQTILISIVTSFLAIQTFQFGYDPTKFPVFIAMLGTIGLNFLSAIVLTLVRIKEIPAFVKNKFRELNEFRQDQQLPDATYLEEAAKELAEQIASELRDEKERARLKKERKTAKMTEDTKIALAREANKKIELEIRRLEASNKRTELEQIKRENKTISLLTTNLTKEK